MTPFTLLTLVTLLSKQVSHPRQFDAFAISSEKDTVRPMAKIADLRRQIDQLDRQIVDLLARRTKMAKGVHDQMEDEEDPEWDQQVLANWLEEGFDHGLEDAPLEKVCRATMDMGKKAVEIG